MAFIYYAKYSPCHFENTMGAEKEIEFMENHLRKKSLEVSVITIREVKKNMYIIILLMRI